MKIEVKILEDEEADNHFRFHSQDKKLLPGYWAENMCNGDIVDGIEGKFRTTATI